MAHCVKENMQCTIYKLLNLDLHTYTDAQQKIQNKKKPFISWSLKLSMNYTKCTKYNL